MLSIHGWKLIPLDAHGTKHTTGLISPRLSPSKTLDI